MGLAEPMNPKNEFFESKSGRGRPTEFAQLLIFLQRLIVTKQRLIVTKLNK